MGRDYASERFPIALAEAKNSFALVRVALAGFAAIDAGFNCSIFGDLPIA